MSIIPNWLRRLFSAISDPVINLFSGNAAKILREVSKLAVPAIEAISRIDLDGDGRIPGARSRRGRRPHARRLGRASRTRVRPPVGAHPRADRRDGRGDAYRLPRVDRRPDAARERRAVAPRRARQPPDRGALRPRGRAGAQPDPRDRDAAHTAWDQERQKRKTEEAGAA